MPDSRVSVVMITHNRRVEAVRALGRLRDLPEQPAVYVVDNGSTDGTADAVRREHPALASFLAGASIVRVEAFEEVGGFHHQLWLGGEEELMAADLAAAGWELCYLPTMQVHHEASVLRDPHLRRKHGIRNTLWFTWLRRPVLAALRRTAAVLGSAPRDRVTAAALGEALRGAHWVVRERRVLPPRIEQRFRILEKSQRSSRARRYVS